MAESPQKYQVGVCLFSGADILDFSGPIEILSHVSHSGEHDKPTFKIVQIASTPTILAGDLITITPNTTFTEASKNIADFDILVVPGGHPELLQKMATSGSPEVEFIKEFNELEKREGNERIIFSVCTGALLVGATGALKGMKATTHHMALDILRQIDGSIDVVSHGEDGGVGRYVDGGVNENGVRVVTAGGVTCGLDASLYIAEMKAGKGAAEAVAGLTEYEWKRA